tara:strand:- start:9057 stop:11042 length:1986 start_codon:yes stop_codon:yes gene_type:complete
LNRLKTEKSEYLLQHSNNPVDWFPWCDEAFEKAKEEDKPIFLSIGYSSCHWCHVMEKESFENKKTAKLLNENFISIKVDREERPDIDSLYMYSVQMINGNGGWPASIFMDYEGKPFFAGTYFPPKEHHNIPAFNTILVKIIDLYKNHRKSIDENINLVFENLNGHFSHDKNIVKINNSNLYSLIEAQIKQSFDFDNGGFGDFPKFPETSKLFALMLLEKKYNNQYGNKLLSTTLKSMINGGIFDQLGGGFSRYSTDKKWIVPHFEKMLYDNGLLLSTISKACKLNHQQLYIDTIEKLIDFLINEMKSSKDLFYSSQDADSGGVEGSYYTWSYEELNNQLERDDFNFIKNYWNISKDGDLDGKNILNVNEKNQTKSNNLEKIKNQLISIRNTREKPNTDKKIITSWNSLVISGLCDSYNLTKNQNHLNQAIKTANSILDNLSKNNSLYHTQNNNKGFLEDYSYFTKSLFDLYNSSQISKWLILACKFNSITLEKFWDAEKKLFFDNELKDELIIRTHNLFDPMIPNSAAIASINCYMAYKYTSKKQYLDIATTSLNTASELLSKHPLEVPNWFNLYYLINEENIEIFISGDRKNDFYNQAKEYIQGKFLPASILVSQEENDFINNLPISIGRKNDKQTKIYICKNYVCDLPIDNIDDLMLKL